MAGNLQCCANHSFRIDSLEVLDTISQTDVFEGLIHAATFHVATFRFPSLCPSKLALLPP
jgi:hypothetical protein